MKQVVREVAIIMGIVLCFTTLSAFFHPKRPAWYQVMDEDEKLWSIDEQRAAELVANGNVLWVDARKAENFDKAHYPGAISLDLDDWGNSLFQHQTLIQASMDFPVIVYCDGNRCDRSKDVAKRLRELMAMDPVYLLKGKWQNLVPKDGDSK